MKVKTETNTKTTIILEKDLERSFLNVALQVVYELCNDAVRKQRLNDVLIRNGLDIPMHAGQMRDFMNEMLEYINE